MMIDSQIRHLALVSILVDDYDRAIDYYTNTLGFQLLEDTQLNETKRWVVVSPSGGEGCSLLLAKASTEQQKASIGDQCGGRVFLFLYTNDFNRDYSLYLLRGVEFVRSPRVESYGTVAVFRDCFGNLWDLLEPTKMNK
nr:VOC family protein [uncultured Macellibacteroides sp.]